MKRCILIMTGLTLLTPAIHAREQSLLARVTVYWASGGRGSDRYTRQHKCATGLRLRSGHCAVDPRKIPYGSRIVFPDGQALAAVDTGTAVKNRKAARKSGRTVYERNALVVDRFFETKRQALTWANRNPLFMTVRVVTPNSRGVAQMPPPRPELNVIKRAVPVTRPQSLPGQALATNASGARNPLNRIGH